MADLVREWGGRPESTVLLGALRAPAPQAALINATMAHAMDFDDAYEPAVLHAGVCTVPAGLATAERVGHVSGKDLIAAVAGGIDVACRLGDASNVDPSDIGFMYTSLYGVFGAAATAGKLLGLTREQLVNAFGIAYAQAAGNFQAVVDGALTKRMQAGFAASAGVMSALLAARGLTGAKESLEGRKGLFPVYLRGDYDPDALSLDLGKEFRVERLSYKPYPACRATHAAIDAALWLAHEKDIRAEAVEAVSVRTGEMARLLCEPLEAKQRPRVFVDAQFSIPWTVATAFVKHRVAIDDVSPEAITNEKVLAVASRVTPEVDDAIGSGRGTPPAEVKVKLRGSDALYVRKVDVPRGHPDNPMTWDELCDKFRDCAHHGARSLPGETVERLIALVAGLEKVKDVGEIAGLIG